MRYMTLLLASACFFCLSFSASATEVTAAKEYRITTAAPLKAAGVTASVARMVEPATVAEPKISVYTVFDKEYGGQVHLRAYRDDGRETARSLVTAVASPAGQAKTLVFIFPENADILSAKKLVMIDTQGFGTRGGKSFSEEAIEFINELFE